MRNYNEAGDKNLGFRFLMFRKAIRKTEMELASELNISESKINAVETGAVYPEITWTHYLYKKYGLNINWLLTRGGSMFIDNKFQPAQESPHHNKYAELTDLMQVPEVEQAINAALTEICALLLLEKLEKK